MLRLEPLFSLEKDVFPKIPREHLLVPPKLAPRSSESSGGASFLNFKGAALSMIGRYNSDTIILSYIGFYDVRRCLCFEGNNPQIFHLSLLVSDFFRLHAFRKREQPSFVHSTLHKQPLKLFIVNEQCQ
jgi:hypothetical protein